MKMERCLVDNYLLKRGMNYFGKRDLIYIDMQGDEDVGRLFTKEYVEKEEPAAEGGDDDY